MTVQDLVDAYGAADVRRYYASTVCESRRTDLSYTQELFKLQVHGASAELLDLDDLAHHFPYLKSREKMLAQDQIWKFICEELGWQYIASV